MKILLNLPELLPVVSVAKKKGRNGAVWRPNPFQMREGFVTRLNVSFHSADSNP